MEQLKNEVGYEEDENEDDSYFDMDAEGAPTLMWKPASVATMQDHEDLKVIYANPIACASVILVKQLSTGNVSFLSLTHQTLAKKIILKHMLMNDDMV